jgi:hypothetical protein
MDMLMSKRTHSNSWKADSLGLCVVAILLALCVGLGVGCQPKPFSENPDFTLEFSADTILFDTVFTSIGSITLPLKVYNWNEDAVLIESIELVGGGNSQFRVNIDGEIGPEVLDWPLNAGDSLWVFVEVTVDPSNSSNPFVIEDDLLFRTNGNNQTVKLAAWGQNAYFHGGLDKLTPLPTCTETWNSDRPHVIYGIVEVETDCSLTILPGTQIYVHPGGGLLVYQSSLNVIGQLGSEVVFQGDRLEQEYESLPGQWGIELDFAFETEFGVEEVTVARGGIWLYGGVDCQIQHAVLKNGTIGLQVDTTGTDASPALNIQNTRIFNMSATGLFAQGATIDGYNNLIYDCGMATVALTLGGVYRFDHCTFANYWSSGAVRQSPSVLVTDWYEDVNGQIQYRSLEGSELNNCIVWGNNYSLTDFDELVLSVLSPPSDFLFRNCALDVQDVDFPFELLQSCTVDATPDFTSISNRDFHLGSNNAIWNGGQSQFSIGLDLDGLPRSVGIPDKGCFERQQ